MKSHYPYRHKRATPVIRYPQAVWHPLPQCPGCRYETYLRGPYGETLVLVGYRYGRCVYEGEAPALNWSDQDDDSAFYAEEELVAEFLEQVIQACRLNIRNTNNERGTYGYSYYY